MSLISGPVSHIYSLETLSCLTPWACFPVGCSLLVLTTPSSCTHRGLPWQSWHGKTMCSWENSTKCSMTSFTDLLKLSMTRTAVLMRKILYKLEQSWIVWLPARWVSSLWVVPRKYPKCGDKYLKCDRCSTTLWALRKTTQSESTNLSHIGHS